MCLHRSPYRVLNGRVRWCDTALTKVLLYCEQNKKTHGKNTCTCSIVCLRQSINQSTKLLLLLFFCVTLRYGDARRLSPSFVVVSDVCVCLVWRKRLYGFLSIVCYSRPWAPRWGAVGAGSGTRAGWSVEIDKGEEERQEGQRQRQGAATTCTCVFVCVRMCGRTNMCVCTYVAAGDVLLD